MSAVAVEERLGALTAWLGERLGTDDVAVIGCERPPAGQSNDTVLCEVQAAGHSERLVIRRQADGTTIFRHPDVLREARVLQGLAESAVPVPAVRWVEPDPAVLGAPFFVMERVEGRVPLGKPSIHAVGWLATLTPGERHRLWSSALDALVGVHQVDWRAGHGFLLDGEGVSGTSVPDHVAALTGWYRWSTGGRPYPITDAAASFLEDEAPRVRGGEPVLLWGDARVGNMIFSDDHTVAAVIDWETASVGPAGRDVAHWLFFDEFQTAAVGIDRLEGWPDRDATVGRYEEHSGRRLRDMAFFELLEAFFMAITLIRQADARVRRGLAPPDTTMGHDNTITQMLARQLGLPVPELSVDYLAHRGVTTKGRLP